MQKVSTKGGVMPYWPPLSCTKLRRFHINLYANQMQKHTVYDCLVRCPENSSAEMMRSLENDAAYIFL